MGWVRPCKALGHSETVESLPAGPPVSRSFHRSVKKRRESDTAASLDLSKLFRVAASKSCGSCSRHSSGQSDGAQTKISWTSQNENPQSTPLSARKRAPFPSFVLLCSFLALFCALRSDDCIALQHFSAQALQVKRDPPELSRAALPVSSRWQPVKASGEDSSVPHDAPWENLSKVYFSSLRKGEDRSQARTVAAHRHSSDNRAVRDIRGGEESLRSSDELSDKRTLSVHHRSLRSLFPLASFSFPASALRPSKASVFSLGTDGVPASFSEVQSEQAEGEEKENTQSSSAAPNDSAEEGTQTEDASNEHASIQHGEPTVEHQPESAVSPPASPSPAEGTGDGPPAEPTFEILSPVGGTPGPASGEEQKEEQPHTGPRDGEQGQETAAGEVLSESLPPVSTTTTTTGTPSAFNVKEALLAPVPTGAVAAPLVGPVGNQQPETPGESGEGGAAAAGQEGAGEAQGTSQAQGGKAEAAPEQEQKEATEGEKSGEKKEEAAAGRQGENGPDATAETPSKADLDKAAAEFVKKEGGVGSLEKKLSEHGPKLTEEQTKTFVDTQEVAQNVRKLIGLKAGSNLHLENQKLIKAECDLATFGPEYCAARDNPNALSLLWSLEHRKNTIYFIIALITLAFGIAVQTCIRLLERKISEGKDEFSKEVMETAFRQIATISIVNVILWGTMQSNIAEVLDELVFGDVMPPLRDSDTVLENVSPMLEVLFEELFFVSVILLVWYVVFVILFQCMIRQIIEWMRKIDEEEDIPLIAREAESQNHRYEFADNVQAMSIPGVDPSGYYFMEYLRASLLKMAIEMIRLPNSTLFFLMIIDICLRPTFSFRLGQEAGLISGLSATCLLGMLLVWAYTSRIEKQLLPRHVPHYLVMRYHMEVGGDTGSEYLKEFAPPYKLQKQKNAWPGVCSTFLWGTTLPNKHQQLFCFWANGPNIVLRAVEASFFCQLLVLAWWVQLFRSHPATWLTFCWWGNVVVVACAAIQFALLKSVVYTVLLALNSGMLVDPELLEKVWDLQRAENVRRTAELIDALRVQSTLFAISEGGDMFWRQLLIRSKGASRQAQEQRLTLWAALDEEHQGEINRAKIFKFLTSQGLPIKSEAGVNDFLHVFDRNHKGGVNEDEFFVMVMVVKQMLMEPLDRDAVRELFEGRYGIPWTSPVGIDLANLSKILAELRLTLSEGKKRYLLDFIGGKRGTTAVSPDHFVSQLQAMEEQALNPIQNEGGRGPAVSGAERV
ncbi:hypothetical protein NCLIV_030900 [Neospora caninum Liverpool]|uniref:EF-hand domain-containing protein n=1 Tax=Neospora caninum (strain Liverpool) TaxID=572307 RepID=F0VHU2_NEOCL|nr:hypothetical protein NCLIV_030900 [Neospora caninum Liverpool]CBZ53303.1 hypothetical protein NCLIV_030900 [Neospora caninum Liverpool]|eukprot:XP_003883335.1 hypothetical protein NCLIV_030900 [Neospora caninum Liverpool]